MNIMLVYRKLIYCVYSYVYKQYLRNTLLWSKAYFMLTFVVQTSHGAKLNNEKMRRANADSSPSEKLCLSVKELECCPVPICLDVLCWAEQGTGCGSGNIHVWTTRASPARECMGRFSWGFCVRWGQQVADWRGRSSEWRQKAAEKWEPVCCIPFTSPTPHIWRMALRMALQSISDCSSAQPEGGWATTESEPFTESNCCS